MSDASRPSLLSGVSYLDIYENLMDGFAEFFARHLAGAGTDAAQPPAAGLGAAG